MQDFRNEFLKNQTHLGTERAHTLDSVNMHGCFPA